MNKKILAILLLSVIFAIPLTENDYDQLVKIKTRQHILYENYTQSDNGPVSTLGYHLDSFFHDNLYFALAIFGAIEGERGGYGIAAVGLGYSQNLFTKLIVDTKFLIGSGGGGGLKAGGGFAIKYSAGLGYEIMKDIFLEAKIGYLTFPTGSYSTNIFNIGVSFQNFLVYLPYLEN